MEMLYIVFFTLVALVLAYKLFFSFKSHRFVLPPGPLPLPIVGHLPFVKPPVHRLFLRLSRQYGPIFSLRFGSRRVLVVSSLSLAQECFTGQKDVVLSNRPLFLNARYIAYNHTTLGTTPYGDHWRNLRRICSVEILSSHRLSAFLPIRKDEIRRMVTRLSREIHNHGGDFVRVELQPLLSDLTFNNIVRMVAGKRYYGVDVHNEDEANMFQKLVAEILANSGANHPGDYLPFLKVFGHKYEKKVKALGEAMDAFLQRLLDNCRRDKEVNSMVSHLLSLQEDEPRYYTDETIKGLMQAMMVAGTDTSAVTLEWAMSNLLQNPEILNKTKIEIDNTIGQDRLIDESDISNLSYLQNIVSETLRLYPTIPLLLPREASEDTKIGGYDVPRGTILIVNAWAIHRDPELWKEAESFRPERWCSDGRDENKHMLPFGNGRRICPGAGLAKRIVALALGSLIQCFDWKKITGKDIDMAEQPGMIFRKKEPLRAMCRPRPIIGKLSTQFEA